jgi:hypothetical protein
MCIKLEINQGYTMMHGQPIINKSNINLDTCAFCWFLLYNWAKKFCALSLREIIYFIFFYVSLTVHLSITLDNDKLDALIFYTFITYTLYIYYIYIYYNTLHVSSNILLILRSSNCINTASVIVTVSKWPSGEPESHLLS